MMTITKGKGDLGKIYEKLRKRSYRWGGGSGSIRHANYVRGVRDALQEVKNASIRRDN